MLIAHYIGPAKPGIAARLGWWLTVTGQKAPYDYCTHTEAIHEVHGGGVFTIASSSIVDRGVRVKRAALRPGHWLITDVPQWDVERSRQWFADATDVGMQYDKRGALATMLPGRQDNKKAFCTEAVLDPFVKAPHYYTPAMGLSLCLSMGFDVTADYL